ncbi:MAG TPA: ribbon-helix-helix protein, CopG family [Gemmatimonadaceae bacterium]|nr:ribbon-helix-helix protein, CopG family [Gemmatimonadaceae bacterium]
MSKRLNVNLPDNVYRELETIAAKQGRSLTDVIRTAFSLTQIAHHESEKGNVIAVATPGGKVMKQIVLPK